MKITIYTITDCQFSAMEKQYLTAHNLPFEEKNLETNREFLTEMLSISNNFAGTPVTKVEKDDGQLAVLKGFTASEFDTTLGFAKPAASTVQPEPVNPATYEPQEAAPAEQPLQPVPNPVMDQPIAPSAPTYVAPQTLSTMPDLVIPSFQDQPEPLSAAPVIDTTVVEQPFLQPIPYMPEPVQPPVINTPQNDPLNSILTSLQEKSNSFDQSASQPSENLSLSMPPAPQIPNPDFSKTR